MNDATTQKKKKYRFAVSVSPHVPAHGLANLAEYETNQTLSWPFF
jgi:hypothetical protein